MANDDLPNVQLSALADLTLYVIELSAAVDALAELVIANSPDPGAAQKQYSESRARLEQAGKRSAVPRWRSVRKRKPKN
jgi:hypothetical protein